jgi:hypothetical protein
MAEFEKRCIEWAKAHPEEDAKIPSYTIEDIKRGVKDIND